MHLHQLNGRNALKRHRKGVSFFDTRYSKGVPFLPKMVYKRYGVELPGGASPYKTFLSIPRGVSIETRKTLFGILAEEE